MILMLIFPLIGLVSLQYFALNFSIQGLNRAIIFTPIELMYKSVIAYGEKPYFIREDFEDLVLSYYDKVLTRYTRHYEAEFYYYNPEDGSMCLLDTCDGVEITINCKLNATYYYHRVMYYEMSEASHG